MSQTLTTEHRGPAPAGATLEDSDIWIGALISKAVTRAIDAAGQDQEIVSIEVNIGDVVATHIGMPAIEQLYEVTLETRLR